MEDSQYAELASKLEAWLQVKFPERTEQKISGLLSPEAGASNETILFDLSWHEKGTSHSRGLVVRLEPVGEGIFPAYDLALQFRTMDRLQHTDVIVPTVLALEPELTALGRPFYLMERLDGRYLADNPPYQMEGWLTKETAEVRGAMWRNAITGIGTINRVDWQQLGFSDLWDADNFSTPLAQLLDYYTDFLDWAESRGRPFPKLHPVLKYLKEHQPANDPIALCWGDAKPPNLMLANSGSEVVGLLDWEMVHLGNPVHDLSWWLVLDDSLTTGLGLPKLEGLPSRSEMIALWEQSSGYSAAALDYYELLSNFQFAVIMHRVGTRLTAQGIFQAEDEFDMNNNSTLLIDEQIAK
ncbi:MAG: aminoglycoside phosphotransferase (APT) family kinase protein, partial [Halieaceae bacterium]